MNIKNLSVYIYKGSEILKNEINVYTKEILFS